MYHTTLRIHPTTYVLLKRKADGNILNFIKQSMAPKLREMVLNLDENFDSLPTRSYKQSSYAATFKQIGLDSETRKCLSVISKVTGETEYAIFSRVLQQL